MSSHAKLTRTKSNLFDPILSSNNYVGHIKENERIVQIQPFLNASDTDPSYSLNGYYYYYYY